jgi:thioredoxin 1
MHVQRDKIGNGLQRTVCLTDCFICSVPDDIESKLVSSACNEWRAIKMAMMEIYAATEPTRAEVDAMDGAVLLEFGAPWCGYCQAAQRPLKEAMTGHASVHHIKIEDGKGRRLGRSFGVKLWPTLVFLKNGKEMARLVRPEDASEIGNALAQIDENF